MTDVVQHERHPDVVAGMPVVAESAKVAVAPRLVRGYQEVSSGRPDPVTVKVASTNMESPPTSTVTSSQRSAT